MVFYFYITQLHILIVFEDICLDKQSAYRKGVFETLHINIGSVFNRILLYFTQFKFIFILLLAFCSLTHPAAFEISTPFQFHIVQSNCMV